MKSEQMTFFQAVDALAQQIPFSRAKVENVLAVHLREVRRTAYTVFLEGGPCNLADGHDIARIDLRVGADPGDGGFLVLEFEGNCVTLGRVRSRYENLEVTGTPRGRSLDEATTYSAQMPWGRLSFGFKQRNPECLASIAFDPAKAS